MNRQPPHVRDQRFAAARRERRERNRKKPDILGAIRVLVALVVVFQCIRVAFTSPRLQLREVRVAGTQRLTAEQVQRLGGIPIGQNIFRCNLVQVSQQLRRDPVIEETYVTRELPGTIHVTVRDRVPAFQVSAGAGRFDADKNGFVFQRSAPNTRGLPLLQVAPKQLPRPGEKLPEHLVRALYDCTQLAQEHGLNVRNLRVDGRGELWLNVETGTVGKATPRTLAVRLGRDTDLPEKFRDIRQALTGWPELTAKASYLNVMCAGRPAYMTAAETTETN